MPVLAIDPGPIESAYVVWNGETIIDKYKTDNQSALSVAVVLGGNPKYRCVIEQVCSYGMAVGAEVFETVFWSGRFAQAFGAKRVDRLPRLKVKMHLCHDSRAKDANIRQALIDRFGAPGTKKDPGVRDEIHIRAEEVK